MKKSEMTVTMPLATFNEYEEIRKKRDNLIQALADCFDTKLYEAKAGQNIDFDATKAMELCKQFIPYKYLNVDVEIKV